MLGIRLKKCVICEEPLGEVPRFETRICGNPSCRFEYERHLQQGGPTCRSCGRPLQSTAAARGMRTCGDLRCLALDRRLVARDDVSRCRVCRVPLPPNAASGELCDDGICRGVLSIRRREEIQQQRRAEFERQKRLAEERRREQAAAEEISDPEGYQLMVIPHFAGRLTPLPARRREEIRQHLTDLVEELQAEDEEERGSAEESPHHNVENPWPDVGPAGEALTAAVCAHCRGFCCQQGGTHAFLSVQTLRTLLKRRPELTSEDLVEAYLAHLPEVSYEGSCVFHGEAGCTLPSEMRAATCGLYFCWGQQEMRAALEKGAPPRAFVAAADGDAVVSGTFLSLDEQRERRP